MYVAGEASVVAAGDSDRNQSISSALSHRRTRFCVLVLDLEPVLVTCLKKAP